MTFWNSQIDFVLPFFKVFCQGLLCELSADEPVNVCCCMGPARMHMWKWYLAGHMLTEQGDVFDCGRMWVGSQCSLIQLPDTDLMPPLNQSPCPPLDSSPRDLSLPPQRTQEKQRKCLRPSLHSGRCLGKNKLDMKSLLGLCLFSYSVEKAMCHNKVFHSTRKVQPLSSLTQLKNYTKQK